MTKRGDSRGDTIESLFQISSEIVSDKYLNEILRFIVNITARMMKSKICSILLLDEKKRELYIVATQSLSEEYINKPNLKVGEGISGIAIKNKSVIMSPDVRSDKRFKYPEIARKENFVSMISVPISIKGRPVGVVNSYTPKKHKHTKKETTLLQTIANQAGLVIENSKLMEEINSTKQLLEIRKSVERAKGILMRDLAISEDEAYKIIQRKSMDTCRPMKEIAEAVILTYEIKK
ncbi:MAG: GAF and ANTAR domain-containing protein [Endomicrobiia bacterium]|nr:GAF and ANTAR domain-containing protein [Endomicrobiia bacterium]